MIPKRRMTLNRWPQGGKSLGKLHQFQVAKSLYNWCQFEDFVSEADKIPWDFIRMYAIEIASLMDYMERYRSLFSDLKTFSPLTDKLDEIQSVLEEGVEWLLDCNEKKIDQYTAEDNLRSFTARSLKDTLDSGIIIFRGVTITTPKNIEEVFDDIEQIGERLYEEIQLKGYGLCEVFFGGPPLL